MAACLALRMFLSSPDGKCRDHGEREIAQRQTPQSEPIMRDLPDAGTQLVDAHKAVNRGVGGEHPTQRDGHVGDCFARPCEAGGEKLRQAGCKKEEGCVLRPREPGPDGLAHKAGLELANFALTMLPSARAPRETRSDVNAPTAVATPLAVDLNMNR